MRLILPAFLTLEQSGSSLIVNSIAVEAHRVNVEEHLRWGSSIDSWLDTVFSGGRCPHKLVVLDRLELDGYVFFAPPWHDLTGDLAFLRFTPVAFLIRQEVKHTGGPLEIMHPVEVAFSARGCLACISSLCGQSLIASCASGSRTCWWWCRGRGSLDRDGFHLAAVEGEAGSCQGDHCCLEGSIHSSFDFYYYKSLITCCI